MSLGSVLGGIQSDTERRTTRLSSSVDGGNDDGAQRIMKGMVKSNLLLHENLLALEWQKATICRPTLMS
jgi:hypothetical protein